MIQINYQTYRIPIDSPTCHICGLAFQPGDSVTLAPATHRACDPTAVLLDGYIDRALTEIKAEEEARPDFDWDSHPDGWQQEQL